jgi:hypothetical protein
MVTTTTKTLNYSKVSGNSTNSINATINSTPGINGSWFGKVPAILKLLELALIIVSIALIASLRSEAVFVPQNSPVINGTNYYSYAREMFLVGEVYFLCAHTWALGTLMIILLSYAFHTVSSVIVPKASTVENWMNMLLALALLTAGIVELIETEQWKWHYAPNPYNPNSNWTVWTMNSGEYAQRLAAGIIALIEGLLFLASFALSYKELSGPAKDH